MLLTPKPSTVATHEQNIVWSITELIKAQNNSGYLPTQITEANGYYPSDIVSVVPIRTVDGGYRHVLRILMPVNPGYYGAAFPVWQFVGDIFTTP